MLEINDDTSNRVSEHYDSAYFDWQKRLGITEGWTTLPRFCPYISAEDCVLDFGCGGGFLLRNLAVRRRIGVEVNSSAIEVARRAGIEVFSVIEEVPEGVADVVISNHALEHTLRPLDEVKGMWRALKAGGTLVLVVPCESYRGKFDPRDRHHHLYTWNPRLLGNLLLEARFDVKSVDPYFYRAPRGSQHYRRFLGRTGYHFLCRLYGRMNRTWVNIRAVAKKPLA